MNDTSDNRTYQQLPDTLLGYNTALNQIVNQKVVISSTYQGIQIIQVSGDVDQISAQPMTGQTIIVDARTSTKDVMIRGSSVNTSVALGEEIATVVAGSYGFVISDGTGWRPSFGPSPGPLLLPSDGLYKIGHYGDSITQGTHSVAAARERVWEALRLVRGDISFIGPFLDGAGALSKYTLGEWDHGGVPGQLIQGLAAAMPGYVAASGVPHIGIIEIGVNNSADGATLALQRMSALFAVLRSLGPNTIWIICDLSRVPINLAYGTAFNAGLPAIIAAAGANFVFALTYSTLTEGDIFATNDVHPTDTGMTKVGEILAQKIETYLAPRSGLPFPRAYRTRFNQPGADIVVAAADSVVITNPACVPKPGQNFLIGLTVRIPVAAAGNNVIWRVGNALGASILLVQNALDLIPLFNGGNIGGSMINAFKGIALTSAHRIHMYGDVTTNLVSLYFDGVLGGMVTTAIPWGLAAGVSTSLGAWIATAVGAVGQYDNAWFHTGPEVPSGKQIRTYIEKDFFEGSPTPGRTAAYLCNEGAGAVAADSFGSGLNGTFVAATWQATVSRPWNDSRQTAAN